MKSIAQTGAGASPRLRARPVPRRIFFFLLAAALVVAGGYLAYERYYKPQPIAATTGQPVAVARGSVAASVNATGSVTAATAAKLSFRGAGSQGITGVLTEVVVSAGQAVKKGDVLARLDTTDLQLQLTQAQAQLSSAEAKLASLQAGGRAEDVAQAQAQLDSARAKLSQVKAGASAAERQAAEAAVVAARAQLEKAQADLTKLQTPPTQDEITAAKASEEKAKIALQNAQAAYDKIAWKPDAGASKEAMALWQADADYQAALANYNIKMAGPRPEDVAAATKSVDSATAQLASAQAKLDEVQAGPTAEDLAIAQAAVSQAESQLALKRTPATEADLQVARAAVDQAKAAVQSAQNNLDGATLVAPFDGVVASVNATAGETVSGPLLTLVDPKGLRVDVSLAETDVAKVEVGQAATLTFEALGGQRLQGKVTAIAPSATVQSGVATYLVSLSIEGAPQPREGASGTTSGQQPGARTGVPPSGVAAGAGAADPSKVKAGMTANASIIYTRKDNVLVVPNRAVRLQGQDRVVDVLVDGKTETRVVSVGMSNDQVTEILDGLEEGDQVLIPGTSTAQGYVPGLTGGTYPGGQGGMGGGLPR
ncbi:MAG: HlyD family efflux transporter periplasmic adaptor subunit [Chloroflexota bacterium]